MRVRVLTECETSNGKAYMPAGKGPSSKFDESLRYLPCLHCKGTGEAGKWVELPEFLLMLVRRNALTSMFPGLAVSITATGTAANDRMEFCRYPPAQFLRDTYDFVRSGGDSHRWVQKRTQPTSYYSGEN